MNVVDKVKAWADSKRGGARYISSDSNVTYEDIVKVCEMAKVDAPVSRAEAKPKVTEPKDGYNKLDN
jgi:hypothetical protein